MAAGLFAAAESGGPAGLRLVYAGNFPGRVGDSSNTRCPGCARLLIERTGYRILSYNLTEGGCCPSCGEAIPGRWARAFRTQIAHRPFIPRPAVERCGT